MGSQWFWHWKPITANHKHKIPNSTYCKNKNKKTNIMVTDNTQEDKEKQLKQLVSITLSPFLLTLYFKALMMRLICMQSSHLAPFIDVWGHGCVVPIREAWKTHTHTTQEIPGLVTLAGSLSLPPSAASPLLIQIRSQNITARQCCSVVWTHWK